MRSLLCLLAAAAAACYSTSQCIGPANRALMRRARCTPAACTAAAKGALLRAVQRVVDPESAARFYEQALGLSVLESGAGTDGRARTLIGTGAGPTACCIELVAAAEGGLGYEPGGGYGGVSLRVASLDETIAAVEAAGGRVVQPPADAEYGAARVPDEDAETTTTVVNEAAIEDPSGYPLRLFEGEGPTAITAVRVSVHWWKRAEEWCVPPRPAALCAAPAGRWRPPRRYASELGWKTLRWQSNLPRDASIVVSVGPADVADGSVGPCGTTAADEPRAALQLQYKYASRAVKHPGGLEALVVAGGGEPMRDADEYALEFV